MPLGWGSEMVGLFWSPCEVCQSAFRGIVVSPPQIGLLLPNVVDAAQLWAESKPKLAIILDNVARDRAIWGNIAPCWADVGLRLRGFDQRRSDFGRSWPIWLRMNKVFGVIATEIGPIFGNFGQET